MARVEQNRSMKKHIHEEGGRTEGWGMVWNGEGGEGPAERAEGDTSGEEGGIGRPRTESRETEAPSSERDMAQGKAVRGRICDCGYVHRPVQAFPVPRVPHEIKRRTRVCHKRKNLSER